MANYQNSGTPPILFLCYLGKFQLTMSKGPPTQNSTHRKPRSFLLHNSLLNHLAISSQYTNPANAQGVEITPMSSQPQVQQLQQPMSEKHEYTAQDRGQSFTGQQPQNVQSAPMPMPQQQQQQQPQQPAMQQQQQYQNAVPLYALGKNKYQCVW